MRCLVNNSKCANSRPIGQYAWSRAKIKLPAYYNASFCTPAFHCVWRDHAHAQLEDELHFEVSLLLLLLTGCLPDSRQLVARLLAKLTARRCLILYTILR